METATPTSDRSFVTPRMLGLWCGLFSAAGYTAANVGLRAVAACDPAWVSAVKSAPTTLLTIPWLILLARRGVPIRPSAHGIRLLILGALVGQFGGNVAFQWSLGVIGLAYAVPLTTGGMIVCGALMGRFFLSEPITYRTLLSMFTLILATVILSLGIEGVQATAQALPRLADNPAPLTRIALGVLAAIGSGAAYAFLGVTIRRNVTRQVPIASVLFIVATVGVLAVGTFALQRLGIEGIRVISPRDYAAMAAAGVCNTAAFVCLTIALRETSIVYVNAWSAVQVAMAGVLGVALFGEAGTRWLVVGVMLTIIGLLLMHGDREN